MNAHLLQAFEVYLDDDRYAVPTLRLITAGDEAQALEIARSMMAESRHHRGAELCRGGERLVGLGTFATRRIPPEARERCA